MYIHFDIYKYITYMYNTSFYTGIYLCAEINLDNISHLLEIFLYFLALKYTFFFPICVIFNPSNFTTRIRTHLLDFP